MKSTANLKLVTDNPAPVRSGPSPEFVRLTRNPKLAMQTLKEPVRFVATPKRDGEVVI